MNCTVKRRPIRHIAPHFGNFINEVINNSLEGTTQKAYSTPPANLFQEEDRFVLNMALPGYKKEDLQIATEKNILTISCDKQQEENESRFRLREFQYGPFARRFRLPNDVDKNSVTAKFENGLLQLVFNKKPEAKAKSITIQ